MFTRQTWNDKLTQTHVYTVTEVQGSITLLTYLDISGAVWSDSNIFSPVSEKTMLIKDDE